MRRASHVTKAVVVLTVLGLAALPAGAGTRLMSKSSQNSDTQSNSFEPSINASASADGRYVAFTSASPNLIAGQVDSNNGADVFVYDRQLNTLILVSRSTAGATIAGNRISDKPTISADGNWVVFRSDATNLVPSQFDPNSGGDVFLFDRVSGTTQLVSHNATAGDFTAPASTSNLGLGRAISSDGQSVVFTSGSNALIAGQIDTPPNGNGGSTDVFLFRRTSATTGSVTLVSHSTAPGNLTTGNNGSAEPVISGDGNWVAFQSAGTNFVTGQTDTNATGDIFLWDRVTGTIVLASRAGTPTTTPTSGAAGSQSASISDDGRFVAFQSVGTDLVSPSANDTNTQNDVFLFDRCGGSCPGSGGTVVLVSHQATNALAAGNDISTQSIVSRNGDYVAFSSQASDLITGVTDGNGTNGDDIFLYSRVSGTNTLVTHTAASATTTGGPGSTGLNATNPRISSNGRYVSYTSTFTNLTTTPGDPNAVSDVFVWDRDTGTNGTNVLVSHNSTTTDTAGLGGASAESVLSDNGQYVTFRSVAFNLATGISDLNQNSDVYLWDRCGGLGCPSPSKNTLVSKVATFSNSGLKQSDTTGDWLPVPQGIRQVSDDGRYAVFTSLARNLVPSGIDDNGTWDVFLYDRNTDTVTLVSHSFLSATTASNNESRQPSISGDGRFVTFQSRSGNIVGNPHTEGNSGYDIFLFDRLSPATLILVSREVGQTTKTANNVSQGAVISQDGNYVAFSSSATNVVSPQTDTNNANDLFIFDRVAQTNKLISHTVGSDSTAAATGGANGPALSSDGRYVAYKSSQSVADLVGGTDGNGLFDEDLYLWDRDTNLPARTGGTNTLISHVDGSATTTGNAASTGPGVGVPSTDGSGRYVVFESKATNLVTGSDPVAASLDVFLFDRTTGNNRLVSHRHDSLVNAAGGSVGAPGGAGSYNAMIARGGLFVAYQSNAAPNALVNGLVDANTAANPDVFLYDVTTQANSLISRSAASATTGSNSMSRQAAISGNGAVVAFVSRATNLITGQIGQPGVSLDDIFQFDRASSSTTLVSRTFASAVTEGNEQSSNLSMSNDGTSVEFVSAADNLIASGDLNATPDAFLYFAPILVSAPASATITEAAGAGHSTTFVVTAAFAPSSPVTINIAPNNAQCSTPTLSPITIDGSNWNTGVTVTIEAVDDVVVDGDLPCSIQTGAASSSDANFNGFDAVDPTVTVINDDVASDLSLSSKSDAPDPVTPGTNLLYTIIVNNAGPSSSSTVSLSDPIPTSTTFVSLPTPAGWSCSTPAVGATGTVTCTIAVLPAGSTTFTLTVKVNAAAAPASTITNTATVTSAADPDTSNQSKIATSTVAAGSADLVVSKIDTPDPVTPGNNITYTITLTNNGPSNATTVALGDTIPTNATFVSRTPAAGWTCTNPAVGGTGLVNCTRASFAPGTAVFTLVVKVDPTAAPASTISNTASVTSATADPSTGDESATAATTVAAASANLSVTKTDSPDPVTPGSNLVYTITVNNAGPSNASTVELSDALPANTTFVSLPTPAGWSCTTPAVGANGTVSCTIASLGLGNSVFTLTVKVDPTATPSSTLTNTATVTSTTTDPTPGNESGTAMTTVDAASADLSITKSDSPDPVTAGSNLTYTITLTNAGPSAASTVSFSDVLPAETTFVSLAEPGGWTCSTPAVGANGTVSCSIASLGVTNAVFTLVVNVVPSTTAGTLIANTATPSSTTTDPNGGNNNGSASTTVAGSADLSVTKVDSPDPVTAGTNLTYTITASNGGPSTAVSASLGDTLPAGTTFVSLASPAGWTCTTPAVGATGVVSCTNPSFVVGNAVFTLVVKVDSSVTAGTVLTNTATVSSSTADPTPGNESGVAATTVAASADLSATKSDAPDPVTAGTNLTWTITATNAGPSDAASVTLNDTLPAGTTFVSLSSPGGWSCTTPAVGAGGMVSCSAASLGLTSAVFTLVAAVDPSTPAASTISNTATVASATPDPNSGDENGTSTTTVGPWSADLSLTKVDTPDPVTAGSNLTYTITVTNAGPSNAATLTFADALPAETTFVSLASPGGWTCTTPAVGAGGAISCSSATQAVGGAVFTLTVNVISDTATGTVISNTATVASSTADPNPGDESGSSSTTVGVGSADMSVAKIDTPDPVTPGGNLTYTITVTNAGPSNATTASLSDTLPAGTTFVSLTSPGGWSCTTPAVGATGTISCSHPSLAVGNAVFTLVVKLDAAATPASTISNTATASSATSDPSSGNENATAVTTVGAESADLSVTKVDSPDPVTPGTNLTYTITVNNAGPSIASTVSLSDTLPSGTTFVSLSSPGDWSCTTPAVGAGGAISCSNTTLLVGSAVFTLTVAVDASTAPAATLSNTATVTSASPDPNPGNESGTSTTTIGPRSADLSVTKADGADPVTAGANLTYTITVGNAGPSFAASVVLSDPLPAGTTFVSIASAAGWSCTTPAVAAGGSVNCSAASLGLTNAIFTLTVAVSSSTAASTVLTNTATVSAASTDPQSSNDNGIATTTVATSADLSTSKVDTPDPVVPNANLTYTIAVTNAGPSDASTVQLSDTLPAGTTFVSLAPAAGWACTTPAVGSGGTVSCSIASLGVTTASFTLVVHVGAGVAPSTVLSNTATVSSATPDANLGNEGGSATTTVAAPTNADLAVTKLDTPDPVTPDSDLTYSIAVTNNGPATASSVTLADSLPAGTTFVSLASPAGWSCTTPAVGANGAVNCSIASLGLTTANFTLVVHVGPSVAGGTVLTNTATVATSSTDPVSGNDNGVATTTVASPTSADLSVTKVDTPDPVSRNSNVTYTITITNGGPAVAANVQLSDALPAGTTFVSLASPAGWSCTTPAVGANGTITCSIASLPPSAAAFTLVAHVPFAVAPATVLTNTATVTSSTTDGVPGNESATASTTVSSAGGGSGAAVSGTKAAGGSSVPGGTVIYTITLANSGPGLQGDNLGNEFTDVLPSTLTLSSASASSGTAVATIATNTVTWNGSIAAGSSVTITIQAIINSNVPVGTMISNQGSFLYDSDGNATNETAGVTDDAGTGTSSDPTTIVVQAVDIPTASQLALLLFAGLLAALALLRLRG